MIAKKWYLEFDKPVVPVEGNPMKPASILERFGGQDKPSNVVKLEERVSELEQERIELLGMREEIGLSEALNELFINTLQDIWNEISWQDKRISNKSYSMIKLILTHKGELE